LFDDSQDSQPQGLPSPMTPAPGADGADILAGAGPSVQVGSSRGTGKV
jgi:hypothetical protein